MTLIQRVLLIIFKEEFSLTSALTVFSLHNEPSSDCDNIPTFSLKSVESIIGSKLVLAHEMGQRP